MKDLLTITGLALVITLAGCANDDSKEGEANAGSSPTGKSFIANAEPVGTVPVGDARKSAKDGDTISVLGHIGGSSDPFIEGIAAFTIVDPKVKWCPPEEGCPTPWDYCCTQNDVKENIATIKFMDEKGEPVSEDARRLLGVKELSLVAVEGTAKRDDEGNLSVLANKVFIRP